MKSVLIVGVGNMGLAMAKRLVKCGVTVFAADIDPLARDKALAARCRIVALADAVHEADAVLIAVVNAAQVSEVLDGPQGLLACIKPGLPVLVMSTIGASQATALAQRLSDAGAWPIDGPMSGGPVRAEQGQMSLMLAGAPPALAAVAPLCALLANRVFDLGEAPGDAMKMKLVNNLLAGINLAAGAQALALAQHLGLDAAQALEVVQASSGASWIVGDRMTRALAGDYVPRAHAHILAKDVGLAMEMAADAGVDMPLGTLAHAAFLAACQAGWADLDDGVLFKLAQQRIAGTV
jgi:3-hydroxyisobutyrate dehydrogenase-like beta-hydroxyacid dehydrogenase